MDHGNEKYEKRRRLGERCGVKAFIAPQRLVEIAAERTDGILTYYIFAGRSGAAGMEDLKTLVRSAYMQGVNDTIYAAIENKLLRESDAGARP